MVNEPIGTIKRLLGDGVDSLVRKILENQTTANHAADFDIPIYNVWKQQTKTEGSNHFGNSEIRGLDNLLYLYTKPFDIVVDPFAGNVPYARGLRLISPVDWDCRDSRKNINRPGTPAFLCLKFRQVLRFVMGFYFQLQRECNVKPFQA